MVIAATSGNVFIEKFLAYLDDDDDQGTPQSEMELIANTCTVSEFPHVFQDIPCLPPQRCIDFEIKLQPDTTPISRVPYRMAPTEMKELKAQQIGRASCRERVCQYVYLLSAPSHSEVHLEHHRHLDKLRTSP